MTESVATPKTVPRPPRRGRKNTVCLPRRVKASLDDFQRRILSLFPGEISQIILYGSYARGEATPDSDVDVLVVVRWSDPERSGGHYWGRVSDVRWQTIIDSAIDAMVTGGPYLSALVVGESLLSRGVPVLEDAKREGKVLWMSRPI